MYARLVLIVEALSVPWFWFLENVLGQKADITQLMPWLWTGGAVESRAAVRQVKRAGITAMIDAREEYDDAPELAGSDLAYLHDPESDNGERKPVGWFADAWEFAKPIVDAGGVVLCHCGSGRNRGPSLAYFLLRASTGMGPHETLALIFRKRPVATLAYVQDAERALVALGLDRGPSR